MRVCLRMARLLYETIIADLARPHSVAHERVGFVFARMGAASQETQLVLAVKYLPVPDEFYTRPKEALVGAEITSAAIRLAMQQVYTHHLCAFQVHQHAHCGMPHFSSIDRRYVAPLVEGFSHAYPAGYHGALLLSNDALRGVVWLPGQDQPTAVERITLVGYPTRIYKGDGRVW